MQRTASLIWVDALLVAATVLLVVVGALLLRRRFSDPLHRDSDSILAISAAITSVYGLVLGLTLAAAWERYQDAETALVEEGNSLFTLSRLAESMQPIDRERLQGHVLGYGKAVVSHELTGNAPQEIDLEPASDQIRQLYLVMSDLHPPDDEGRRLSWSEAVGTFYSELAALDRARGERLALANLRLPGAFWLVIFSGAALTVGSLAAILPANRRLHLVITVSATMLIVALLLLLRELDQPFHGARTVDTGPYRTGLEVLKAEQARAGPAPAPAPAPAPNPEATA